MRVLGSHGGLRFYLNPDSLSPTVTRKWKGLCSEIYCGASLLVISCSCNYWSNRGWSCRCYPYTEGHWMAVQWSDVAEESDGLAPPSIEPNLVCVLWTILNWDQDGYQHFIYTERRWEPSWRRGYSYKTVGIYERKSSGLTGWDILLSSSLSDVRQVTDVQNIKDWAECGEIWVAKGYPIR